MEKFQRYHLESDWSPSALQRSASTNCATVTNYKTFRKKKYRKDPKDRVEAIRSDEISNKIDSKKSTRRKNCLGTSLKQRKDSVLYFPWRLLTYGIQVWMLMHIGFFEPPSCDLQAFYSNSELVMLNGCSKGSAEALTLCKNCSTIAFH